MAQIRIILVSLCFLPEHENVTCFRYCSSVFLDCSNDVLVLGSLTTTGVLSFKRSVKYGVNIGDILRRLLKDGVVTGTESVGWLVTFGKKCVGRLSTYRLFWVSRVARRSRVTIELV